MTGIGIWKSEEVKHSYQALGKIYHLIGMMKNELSYAGSEFGEMFECLSKKVDAPYRNWLLGMKIQMERRDGKTFSEIWEDNVNGFLLDLDTNVFVDKIVELVADQEQKLLKDLGWGSRKLFESKFNLEIQINHLLDIYTNAVVGKR